MMTGGQRALNLSENKKSASGVAGEIQHQAIENRPQLKVLRASADEEVLHQQRLDKVKEEGGRCLWLDS